MEEKFLHHIWKNKLFKQFELFTTTGEKLEILQPGEHNHHSGPDFFNALIKLNGALWAGNLEIHVNASEWNQHRHQVDPAYENVILHVVYEDDQEIRNSQNKLIPTLELKNLIPEEYFLRYEQLKNSPATIACGKNAGTTEKEILDAWFFSLAKQRVEEKTEALREIVIETGNDLLETFYRQLARNFGFKTNALPFFLLARLLPLKILQRHTHDKLQVEALLLGQAGFLEGFFSEKYAVRLQNEYEFLRIKYSLIPLKKEIWKTGSLRPPNFPEIRIAQFAALIERIPSLFNALKSGNSISEITGLLNTEPSHFWKSHYRLDAPSPSASFHLGKDGTFNILINTIVPFLFLYGNSASRKDLSSMALDLLKDVPPENNTVTKLYTAQGIKTDNAFETQALLQLNKNYCRKKKCLDCAIGKRILSLKNELTVL